MRAVWKFDIQDALKGHVRIEDTSIVQIEMPDDAVVLNVEVQHGRPVFWAEVDDANDMVSLCFAVIGTGHPIPTFVAAWEGLWQDGPFVWHLYSADVSDEDFQAARRRRGTGCG